MTPAVRPDPEDLKPLAGLTDSRGGSENAVDPALDLIFGPNGVVGNGQGASSDGDVVCRMRLFGPAGRGFDHEEKLT
jgi:hypothetical protein